MVTEYEAAKREVAVQPFPYPIDLETGRTPYTTLAEIIAVRPEPFWQEALSRATKPVKELVDLPENPDQFEANFVKNVGLAIRALDHGMIDLPIAKRLSYLYGYVFECINDTQNDRQGHVKDFDTSLETYFPTQSGAQQESLRNRWLQENGRYQRFKEYMVALEEIQAAGRPDILLGSIRSANGTFDSTGGMYTEFDFWVEQKIKETSSAGHPVIYADIAEEIPQEFVSYSTQPLGRQITAIEHSAKRLGNIYNRFTESSLNVAREKRFAIIQSLLEETPEGINLKPTLRELGEMLGISCGAAGIVLKAFKERYEINVIVKRQYQPAPETFTAVNYILEAYDALNKPGKKWEYGQLTYRDLADYITEHHPDFDVVNSDRVLNIIDDYLDVSVTEQYPGMPTRRLVPRNPASNQAALKRDIVQLIQNGHPQDPDLLAATLHYSHKDQHQTRSRMRSFLKQIQEEGIIPIDDVVFKRKLKLNKRNTYKAIASLKQKGYAWKHENPEMVINPDRIAEELKEMGAITTGDAVAKLLRVLKEKKVMTGLPIDTDERIAVVFRRLQARENHTVAQIALRSGLTRRKVEGHLRKMGPDFTPIRRETRTQIVANTIRDIVATIRQAEGEFSNVGFERLSTELKKLGITMNPDRLDSFYNNHQHGLLEGVVLNARSIDNPAFVAAIKQCKAQHPSLSQAKIAEQFGTSQSVISRALARSDIAQS